MIVIQTFNRAGWPADSPMELEDDAAAAVLTAVRDYQNGSGRDLHGDYAAAPAGALRTYDEVTEMQWGFDHRHSSGADLVRANAIYVKYNMDRASNARPSHSTHETGRCIDIADNGFLAWLKNGNAKRYGLVFTLSPPLSTTNDLRHAEFFPGTATVALDVTSLDNSSPIPPEESMSIIMQVTLAPTDVRFFLLTEEGDLSHLHTDGEVAIELELAKQTAAYQYTPDDFMWRVWRRGRLDLSFAKIQASPSGWVSPRPTGSAAATLTDAQLAQIAAAIKVPTVDLTAIETLIKAGLTGTIALAPKA